MYKDYEKCSDEELIMRQRDGEEAVTDYIMDKYKNLVRNKAKSMIYFRRGPGGLDSGGNDRAIQGYP